MVDADGVVTGRRDVDATTPSVPAVGAAPTESVNPLVSTLIPPWTAPAAAVPAVIIASETEVLNSFDRLTESQ